MQSSKEMASLYFLVSMGEQNPDFHQGQLANTDTSVILKSRVEFILSSLLQGSWKKSSLAFLTYPVQFFFDK